MESHFLNDDNTLQNNESDNEDALNRESESIDVDDLLEDITSNEDISLDKLDDALDISMNNDEKENQEKSDTNLSDVNKKNPKNTNAVADIRNQNQIESINNTYPNIPLLMNVNITLSVEIGRTKMQIGDVLNMGKGTIVELDKLHNEPVDIVINNNVIAQGQVVAVDEYLGVKILHILDPENHLESE